MNKNEFIEFSAKLGKLLGAKPTMDNYTFSDPKSPVFQIKEKELRSVVRKAKALKDKEAHGIDDIEWDFEEGYIAFMLPGGFALYLSTEADMEMSEANEANEANAVNEATNTLNEASEARMRNKARAIAKFFGIEIDETVGSFGFFASSAGIDKSSYDKIIKIIKQTKDIEKKLGVNFVEVWSKVNSIRFNVYRSEDDIFFKLQGMNESVELNEVTGLPKHKTSVPSHML